LAVAVRVKTGRSDLTDLHNRGKIVAGFQWKPDKNYHRGMAYVEEWQRLSIEALRKLIVLPWLGKNLLVGIIPLAVACLTWLIMRSWLRYKNVPDTN